MTIRLAKHLLKIPLVGAVIFSLPTAFSTEGPSNLLVDTAFVKEKVAKPGWVIIDVRFSAEYEEGHIPGAVLLPSWISKLYADDTKRSSTIIPRLEKTIGQMGVGNESHVIIYGSLKTKGWNPVMFWVFELMGCNSSHSKCSVHFYDGGIELWKAEGGLLEQLVTKAPQKNFKAVAVKNRSVNSDEIKHIVTGKTKVVLVDVRSAAEFDGTDVRSLRGGHIPNAHNIDFSRNFNSASYLLPLPDLKSVYKEVPFDKKIVTYCQTGARAAYGYLALRALGYTKVAIYHDGWRVYGSNLVLPVEDETWFDFNRVNNAVKTIQEQQGK